ncbi:hypothetical protein [Brevundimonas sp.]|jgi:hypothetical protein|uniref:hypothetical protein n=1 Tax=Brevundimonas sp. TaxID=1871086 RepID=UPI0037C17F62
MSVTVTLHIYSGRPDPKWTLTVEQAQALNDALLRPGDAFGIEPSGPPSALGFRGFTIETASKGLLPTRAFIYNRQLTRQDDSLVTMPDHSVERFLLDSAGSAVSDAAREVVLQALDGFQNPPAPNALAAPHYDPGRWNDDPFIMRNNNCYNYANDLITNSFAQPGRGSGQMYTQFSCDNVGAASVRDGQAPTPDPDRNPDVGQIICLVIWPNEDFHWYRKDANDYWSHKPGSTPATNLDGAGNPIRNPETCDRRPYINFCGYYFCDPATVTIL